MKNCGDLEGACVCVGGKDGTEVGTSCWELEGACAGGKDGTEVEESCGGLEGAFVSGKDVETGELVGETPVGISEGVSAGEGVGENVP